MALTIIRRKAKSRDFMIFCRQFSVMLRAGITVLHGLQVLSQQTESYRIKEKLREVILSVEQGNTLSDSFGKHPEIFPSLLTDMVQAGEVSGKLDLVLDQLADAFERQHHLEEKIRSAAVYPLAVTGVAAVVMAIMMLFILPRFAGIFADMGVDLPWITRFLLDASHFLKHFWHLVAASFILSALGFKYMIRTEGGRSIYDRLRLNFPLFGAIYRKSMAARFSRTLGMLLSSGVGIITSLDLTANIINNRVVFRELLKMRDTVRHGQGISALLRAGGLFPPLLGEIAHVGEESGSLDALLARTAVMYEDEVTYVVERLSTILEPALLILISLMVGAIVISITTPLFQIYQSI